MTQPNYEEYKEHKKRLEDFRKQYEELKRLENEERQKFRTVSYNYAKEKAQERVGKVWMFMEGGKSYTTKMFINVIELCEREVMLSEIICLTYYDRYLAGEVEHKMEYRTESIPMTYFDNKENIIEVSLEEFEILSKIIRSNTDTLDQDLKKFGGLILGSSEDDEYGDDE